MLKLGMKKALAVLLGVLFIVSLTAVAASADGYRSHHDGYGGHGGDYGGGCCGCWLAALPPMDPIPFCGGGWGGWSYGGWGWGF